MYFIYLYSLPKVDDVDLDGVLPHFNGSFEFVSFSYLRSLHLLTQRTNFTVTYSFLHKVDSC